MCWPLAVLFFVLSPGVLLTLPPGSRGVLASGQTSLAAAFVHALVFAVAAYWVHRWWMGLEGFSDLASFEKPVPTFKACGDNVDCNAAAQEACDPVRKWCVKQVMIPHKATY